MEDYDKFSLIKASFRQEVTKKVPYSLWKHFPEADKTSEGLANAQLDFQQKFSSDLMKISPQGSYCVVDFGGELNGYRPITASRICVKPPIQSLSDWETLEPVDPNNGEMGVQIKAIELIHKQIENEVPTMMTVFSPFMVATKLDPSILEHYSQDCDLIESQINMLKKVKIEFACSALDAGANGLFIATQHFNPLLKKDEIENFEFQPIKSLLTNVSNKSEFNILHLHGNNPYFKWASQLPNVSGINWHDQRTAPNLKEARKLFDGALLGGLDEMTVLMDGDSEAIKKSINLNYKEFNDRGLIIAPGCVVPENIPDNVLNLVKETVNSLVPI